MSRKKNKKKIAEKGEWGYGSDIQKRKPRKNTARAWWYS